jgi:hypothetical protein
MEVCGMVGTVGKEGEVREVRCGVSGMKVSGN